MATPSEATQKFVPIKEIRKGVVALKAGGYRGILMCSSVNFALKSADEQHAIISGFQNFLNTLDFSIQIVVNSRHMDIRPYLMLLESMSTGQKTELLRIQLKEYIEFIRSFAGDQNIMTKTFYVVVPYARTAGAQVAQAVGFLRGNRSNAVPEESFEESAAQLDQRLALVAGGLAGAGVRAVRLGTEELIELYYRAFNPGEMENPIHLET